MNNEMWARLKQYIMTKNSHGKNELLNHMNEIEIATFANNKSCASDVSCLTCEHCTLHDNPVCAGCNMTFYPNHKPCTDIDK